MLLLNVMRLSTIDQQASTYSVTTSQNFEKLLVLFVSYKCILN